jgi:uncharacterized membrane protein
MRHLLHKYPVSLLVILQLIVCLPFIAYNPIALDEPFSIFHSQQELSDLMQLFEHENNPPLHFILLHFWIKLFGIGAISVRSLSLLFSLLTIPVLYNLTKRILNKELAALGVLFVIFSSFHHFHALEARVYSLFVLLFVLMLHDLHLFLFRSSNNWIVIRLAIWNVLLLYAHYLGGFILIVELLVIILFFKDMNKHKWLKLGFGSLLIVILYLPGIRLFLIRMESFSGKGTWVPPAQFSELYGNILRFVNGKYSIVLIAVLVLFFWIYYREKSQFKFKKIFENREEVFVFLWFGLSYFGMFILSKLIEPIFLDRYLLYTSIPLFLSLLIKLNKLIYNKLIAFTLLIPFILFFKWIPDNNREPDQVVAYLKKEQFGTDLILSPPYYDLTFMYHYDRSTFQTYRELQESMNQRHIYPIFSKEEIGDKKLSKSFFFIDANSNFAHPNNGILVKLKESAILKEAKVFKGGITVYKFEE